MLLEPSPEPDGACHYWHCIFQDKVIGTLDRASKRRWRAFTFSGKERAFKTRREALDFIFSERVT